MLLSVRQLSESVNWELGKEILHLLEVLTEGEDALLFIAKTYGCWELTSATESNSSESSVNSTIVTMTPDSDLTDTSELAQPLAE
jgi:hypothetical protein